MYIKIRRLEKKVAALTEAVVSLSNGTNGLSAKIDEVIAQQAVIEANQKLELDLLSKIASAVLPPVPGTIVGQKIIFSSSQI